MDGELDEVTSFGDCAGIPMDSGPVCESCGVPLVEHLGLIGTCAELQRVQKELSDLRNWKAGAVTASQALRIQEVGAELGVRSGESIEAAVLPGIRDLRDRLGRMTDRATKLEGQLKENGPRCRQCQSEHCCSVRGDGMPQCIIDPDSALLSYEPWRNVDVSELRKGFYRESDKKDAELVELRKAEEVSENLREQLRAARADLVQARLSCQRMPHEVAEHVNALRYIATTQHWSASDLREAIEREVERFAKLGEVRG